MWRFFLLAAITFLPSIASAVTKGPWNSPPKRSAGLEHGTFRSTAMNVDVGYNICLPPDYGGTQRRFPVIYYLHGYEGNESSYAEYANYWRESLSRHGPGILVFVNGGATSFFCDAPDGSVMGETVVRELIAHIDGTYRTQAARAGRSLHGYSMGGFGALKLAFKSPEMFGSVVAYGATLSSAEQMRKHLPEIYEKMFGGSQEQFEANNPVSLLKRNASELRKGTRICLIIGSKDEFLPANRQLHRQLTALQVPASFEEIPGARHKKDSIYAKAAARGFDCTFFQKSARVPPQMSNPRR